MIENFLIYAQIELLGTDPQKLLALRKKQTVAPAKLIEKHAREQAQAAHRPHDIALELADEPVPISEDYLAKIVDELVHNAFKFSQAGTKVQVTLADAPNGVTLTVTDQGRGFSTEHITKSILLGTDLASRKANFHVFKRSNTGWPKAPHKPVTNTQSVGTRFRTSNIRRNVSSRSSERT